MQDFLYLKHKPNNLGKNSFRIVVSLKVSKKAVIRNKIKRRIRNVLNQADLKQGYNIVIITNKSIVNKSFKQIKGRVLVLLEKDNLI